MKNNIGYFIKIIKMYIKYIISILFRVKPIDKYKIVVCSYVGDDYGDNAKYIIDNIINKDNKKYKIIWALKEELIKNNNIPKGIKIVKYKTIRYLYELSTAHIWLDNARKSFVPLKRKGQIYIQLWHGSMPIKKVEKDAKKTLPKIYLKYAEIDNMNANYFLSGSKWTTNLYRESFGYKGEVIELGIPRNDIFYNKQKHNSIKNKVYNTLNIPKETKMILYAPTFRDGKDTSIYKWDYKKLVEKYKQKIGGKVVLLIRLHPNMQNEVEKLNIFNEEIINVTSYPDMQELLITSEIVITDYSSIMFDCGLLKTKCVLYCPDLKEYLKERELYFDIKKLPFPYTDNENDLIKNVLKINDKEYIENVNKYMKKLGICETGKSSQYIANMIMEICDKNEKK